MRVWASLAFILILSSCTVGPNYRPPPTPAPVGWDALRPGATATQPTSAPSSGPTARSADLATWWKTLNDPILDDLILRAVASNLDLRVAEARVRQARAQRDIAAAPWWPWFNLSGDYTFRGSSLNSGPKVKSANSAATLGPPTVTLQPGAPGQPPNIAISPQRIGPIALGGSRAPSVVIQPGTISNVNGVGVPAVSIVPPGGGSGLGGTASGAVSRNLNLFQAGFDATWELDIFGGTRRAVEAATADLEAAEASRRDVLVTLLSEVALDYVNLRGAQRRLAIAYENIAAQQDTVELTQQRFGAGFTNELDVAQAQAQLATTESQVPALEAAARQAMYQLSVLLALPAEALVEELEQAAPIPHSPPEVPVGVPADVLRRRPDIRVAERQLAAATAQIGVATAELFPQFSLTGSFGTQTRDMRHFLDAHSLFWSIGPAVSWPIFQGGQIVANIRVQNALQEQALATYQQTVLTAFQDVESALVAYSNEKVRHAVLAEAVRASQKATDLSNELYSRGLTAFLNVLESQRTLYATQDQLVQSETTAITDLIALYKALGGGWEAQLRIQNNE